MKNWILIPLIFLAGLVIGGLQPRGELRRLHRELDTRKQAERTPPPQERQLASFLNMLPMDTPRRGDPLPASAPERGAGETRLLAGATGLVSEAASTNSWREPTPAERSAAFQARLDTAAEAWKMRTEVARNTFAAKTGFTPQDMGNFDVLMTAMNVRMKDFFVKTAEKLESGEAFTPETGVRLMSDLTQSMVLTYDEMDRKLPATWRNDAGGSFDLVTYVDPNVVKPLIKVADKLPQPGESRARLGGGRPNPFRP
jgi:hypothetical protein